VSAAGFTQVPSIGQAVQDAHQRLVDTGLIARMNGLKPILPPTMSEFVDFFGVVDPQAPTRKLQRAIWFQLNKDVFDDFLSPLSKADKVRVLSATTPYSSLWITALPRNPRLEIDDPTMRINIGIRLNVSPFFTPDNCPVKCRYASSSARVCQDVDLRNDFAHGLSCIFENNQGRKIQHNHVLDLVLNLARQCNLHACRTPKGYYTTDAHGNKLDRKQPDGLINFRRHLNDNCLFDVRGVCPTSASNIGVNSGPQGHNRSMDLAAKDKIDKYYDIATKHQADFSPFIFNTFGGLHISAQNLVDDITKQYTEDSTKKAAALKFNHLCMLSISIMRDNAEILLKSHQLSK
jgi:hypothetical protein